MNDSHLGKVGIVEMAILVLSLVLLGALAVDTTCALPPEVSKLIHVVDTTVCLVFFLDFSVRFYRAEQKGAFLKWGWIDLLASIPNLELLRWGRLVRILRVIRLLRGIRSVQRILKIILQNRIQAGAVSLALTAFLLVAFSSMAVLVCERHDQANIKNAEDAVWWSVATITTVGYGDKYPVTMEGRVLGMFLMITGVGLFGALSGLIASFFLNDGDRKSAEIQEVLSRLTALQGRLEALALEPPRPRANSRTE